VSGRVVVVAGGSAGIGRSIVREFASAGYDVAVLARGRAGVSGAVREVERADRRGVGITVDVSDLQALEEAATRVEAVLGEITIWVNVAFVGALRYFWDTSPEVYQRITDVSYMGYVNGTRVALTRMRQRDRGVVVQVGSGLGYRGIPLQSAYCGAKHAIKGFTESVITELKHEGSKVRLAMVELPGVNTTQFNWNDNGFDAHPMPVPPIFQPETAARAVRYVAEHRRRNIWVGLPTAYTILGNRIAPRLLDWHLARNGVDGQLSPTPAPLWGSNVFTPRDDDVDRGSHGAFDDQARSRDAWSWASMHRAQLLGAAAVVTSAAGIARTRRG
jgi:NAD(P)-dependent dehydrogenase (short-subunit alcohol dehydrogenase family)